MSYKKVKSKLKKLETDGKSLFLAYDHGLEHGPYDFEGKSFSPHHIFSIAQEGGVDGLVCHKGIAEKYGKLYKGVKLIIKLNGKTSFRKLDDPYSPVICSLKEAVNLGAVAVGFTLYPGSKYFNKQVKEFREIQEEAHKKGIPIIVWMYPRGEDVRNELDRNVLAYSSRIGLELGADMIKTKYVGSPQDLTYQVRVAGETKILVAGGEKKYDVKEFLKEIEEINGCGVQGFLIGRNIWLSENPVKLINAIRDIIKGINLYGALKHLGGSEDIISSQRM